MDSNVGSGSRRSSFHVLGSGSGGSVSEVANNAAVAERNAQMTRNSRRARALVDKLLEIWRGWTLVDPDLRSDRREWEAYKYLQETQMREIENKYKRLSDEATSDEQRSRYRVAKREKIAHVRSVLEDVEMNREYYKRNKRPKNRFI